MMNSNRERKRILLSESAIEARDDADLVIIRQRARNPVTDVELRVEDAAEDECMSLICE